MVSPTHEICFGCWTQKLTKDSRHQMLRSNMENCAYCSRSFPDDTLDKCASPHHGMIGKICIKCKLDTEKCPLLRNALWTFRSQEEHEYTCDHKCEGTCGDVDCLLYCTLPRSHRTQRGVGAPNNFNCRKTIVPHAGGVRPQDNVLMERAVQNDAPSNVFPRVECPRRKVLLPHGHACGACEDNIPPKRQRRGQ